MLDLRDLCLEDIEGVCQADLTWIIVLGKKEKLAILVFSSSSTSLQITIFFNGNKVVAYLVKGVSLESTLRCSRDLQSRLRSMSDTLDVLWYLPVPHLAALL